MNPVAHCPAPLTPTEPQRLQALAAYEILDTPVEAAFDDITRIAAQVCGAPIAVVSLIDEGRQWFKSEVGLGVRQTPIATSICAHAILQPQLLEVPDTTLDSRFSTNPLVIGPPFLRFYAGAPLRTPDGHQLGTVCVLDHRPRRLDSEQRDALLALARQTMALMELRRALSRADAIENNLRRLMATAGHDLRQPLHAIGLILELVGKKTSDPSVARQIGFGLDATIQLGQKLDELALASSAAASSLLPERRRIRVQQHFEHLEQLWGPVARHQGVELRFVRCSAQVLSNPEMLDSMLGNLIGNAIKYTPRGRVLVGCRRLPGQTRIDVIDTGIGIAPHMQTLIFDAFRKTDPRSEGLGLGLSIVRSTAEALGHALQLRSVPGHGTTVSLSLPRLS